MQMKKILGVLLAVCFLMSVTAAAVSAVPENRIFDKYGFDQHGFNKDNRDKFGFDKDGHDKNGYDRNGRDKDGYDRNGRDKDGHYKGQKHTKGHWIIHHTKHHHDKNHRFDWFSNDKVWKYDN
jgi:opacity protein-like surface antigen